MALYPYHQQSKIRKNSYEIFSTKAFLVALVSLACGVYGQEPEYVSIEMEIDINKSAADVWEVVGEYCDIEEWDCSVK